MKQIFLAFCTIVVCCFTPILTAQSLIDSTAISILEQCTDYMSQLASIRIDAEVTQDVVDDEFHKIQFTKEIQMQIKRPGNYILKFLGIWNKENFGVMVKR